MKYLRRLLPLLALPLLVVLPACQRPEEAPRPASLLPKDQIISLLTALHLLEAQVDASRMSPDSARALFLSQQRLVFARAHTTDSVFQRSYRYYSIHNKDLSEIYDAVIDSLSRREKKFGKHATDNIPPGHPTLPR